MAKKYVYLLERMQLVEKLNEFKTFDRVCFSSKKKAIKSMDDTIEINKGYNLEKLDESHSMLFKDCLEYDYTWLSTEFNREVKSRLFLRKIVLE